MNKKRMKYQISPFEYGLILAVITCISLVIDITFGIIVGICALILHRKFTKNFSTQEKTHEETPVHEDTMKLVDTLVREQEKVIKKPLDNFSYPIKKGSLPIHIHETLDEMGITTWGQLALCEEKELLYQECFGKKALKKIKAELAKRGFTLNSTKNEGS